MFLLTFNLEFRTPEPVGFLLMAFSHPTFFVKS
jgi:hypothetical protein